MFAAPGVASATPVPPALATVPAADPQVITIKFKDGTDVAAASGRLQFGNASTGQRLAGIVGPDDLAETEPVFDGAPARLDADRARLLARGENVPDLTAFVRVRLETGEDSAAVLAKLNRDPQVELAYPAPAPARLATTPSLTFLNDALFGSAEGMSYDLGVYAAADVPGALGQNVTVAELEYAFNEHHEDLVRSTPTVTRIDPDEPGSIANKSHGTLTAGIIAAKRDGVGIDGIAPNVKLKFFNAVNDGRYDNEAATIYRAVAALQPGDVIQMALQAGPGVPVELTPETYAAVSHAVAQGIIVVEAAGNSSINLDGPAYANTFAQGLPDSGAIIVGAGDCAQTAHRRGNSTYGTRVNVQGPGDCYSSTGGNYTKDPAYLGWAGNATTINDNYAPYADTSAASSAVAGVSAALSSAYEQVMGTPIRPRDARDVLANTGREQYTALNPGHIGPFVNLRQAIDRALQAPDTQITGESTGPVDRPTFAFTGTATTTITGYDCRIVPISGTAPAFAPCSGAASHQPATTLADGQYRFEVRARKGPAGGVDPTPATKTFWVVTGAGDVRVDGTFVRFDARPGHANEVQALNGLTTWVVYDAAQKVRAGNKCDQLSLNSVRCYGNYSGFLVYAGDGNDDLSVSTAKSATVDGGEGNDAISGGDGEALLIGGAGDDTIEAGSGDSTLEGGEGADTLIDGLGNDVLSGGAGSDKAQFSANGGVDTFNGGADTDAAVYSAYTAGVQLSNDGVRNDGAPSVSGDLDNIGSDVENLWGGAGNDTLVGSATTGMLYGQGGDDTFVSATGPGGGLYGGPGIDKVDYSGRTTSVSLQPLSTGAIIARFGGAGLSVLNDIDHVIGTELADVLIGGTGGTTDRALRLEGRGGNDTLTGGSAADVLVGGAGLDQLDGGAGDDRLELKDGVAAEKFWCRAGTDTAISDAADAPQDVAACESRTT